MNGIISNIGVNILKTFVKTLSLFQIVRIQLEQRYKNCFEEMWERSSVV